MQHLAGNSISSLCSRSVSGRLTLWGPLRNDNSRLPSIMGASRSLFAIGDRRGPLWEAESGETRFEALMRAPGVRTRGGRLGEIAVPAPAKRPHALTGGILF